MKIGIIGAGFTGLAAGYYLSKNGYEVVIIEKDKIPGGLALGFKDPKWDWSIEKHYHHFFTNDYSILSLAREIEHKVITRDPKTSVFIDGKSYQLDSPLKVLAFPKLSLFERLRMGGALAFLRFNPFWKIFEPFSVNNVLPVLMGKRAYDLIWKPQLNAKFGKYADKISLAWFWARVKKRTPKLSYPEGGFLALAKHLEAKIRDMGGKFHYNAEVSKLKSPASRQGGQNSKVKISIQNSKVEDYEFDAIILTLPSPLFLKIAQGLPAWYQKNLNKLQGIGAINLVISSKEKFLKDDTYWLSICDNSFPFMAVVDHGNFMDKEYYNNEHVIYVGKYAPSDHPYFKMNKNELLKEYLPYLKKLNPNFELSILNFELFKAPFAQPIIPVNYSKIIPSFETPMPNVFLANIQQVYPWDRGTNYAVELGRKAANLIMQVHANNSKASL